MDEFARVLILETSSKAGQVAVASSDRVLGTRVLPEARRHARDLAARTAELLAEQGSRARDLSAIVVGIGPGSYTGLRVAVASAKALVYATGASLFGVPAFDAIAAGTTQTGSTLEIIADAQQGNVYCQRFVGESAGRIRILGSDEWLQGLHPGSLISGPAAGIYSGRLLETVRLASVEEREPRPESVLKAVLANPERYRSSAWNVEPIYLRGSSAEEKRKKEAGG